MWMTLLAEDKTECAPLPFSRIMFLPPSYTNVLSHLPPPPGPPPPGAHPPPPFPGAPPPPLAPGDQPGLCGLTNDQWHMVLIFSIPLLIALLIALVISRINDSEISLLWLGVEDRFKLTRMGLRERLFGHLLSEDDISSGSIVTGPEITPRRYPNIAFLLEQPPAPPPNANLT